MGFLRDVAAATRSTVRAEGYLEGLPVARPARPTSLRASVEERRSRGAVLVEYKRVSPGQREPALPGRTIEEFVRRTEGTDVAAYSCLATRPSFRGSPTDVLELVRHASRPVLFKDFVVDLRQLEAAERAGASAVLLIARLATAGELDRSLAELASEAHRRGLEVLLELHSEAELSEVEGVPADMYGVNVRDLDTLTIDRGTAAAALRAARDAGLRPLLGLSGIESASDAAWFWSAGTDGILVGTAVARSDDPAAFVRSLERPREGGPA